VGGRAVRELDAGALKIRLDDEEEIAADALFLATGKHELRGAARDVGGRADEPAVGLRCALPLNRDLRSALENCIELHLFDRGYAGLLLQEDGSANLCLSVSRLRLAHAGGVPQLMAELAASEPALAERLAAAPDGGWSAIAGVPYGWRARSTERAVFRLGDQGAVISSLAGDGIAIALTSGELAARHLQGGGPGGANAFQSDLANRSVLPLLTADIVRKLVERAGTRRTVMRLLRHLPWIAPLVARLTRIA
jgi:menaquinone-9 beta-reductase